MIVALCGAGVFAGYVRYAPFAAHVPASLRQPPPDVSIDEKPTHEEDHAAPSSKTDDLLVPSVVNDEVKLVNPVGAIPSDVKPEVFVVNATLAALSIDKAKALGVDIKGRIAYVDFNPAIQKGYGTIEEGNLIKSLQMVLGQFKDIDKFQIIVEGQPIDTIGGNISLSNPLEVIRPGQEQAPTTSEASTAPNPS
jgi:hypothetical protein